VFERYTEEARRSIFFARYEVSVLGAPQIETEHLLLGILKADRNIARSLVAFQLTDQTVRDKIAHHRAAPAAQVSTSVNLPFSTELKRALAYAAEESERFGQRSISPELLLLGLVREESFLAARILGEAGLAVTELRALTGRTFAERSPKEKAASQAVPAADSEGFRDLTRLAGSGSLTSLTGRDTELRLTAQVLSRRTRNSVAIVGDPGVGKTALVEGLAQYLSSGVVPQFAEYRILQAEAASLFPVKPGARAPKLVDEILRDLANRGQTLLALEGLFDLALARFDWGVTEAWHGLAPFVATGRLRCIATGTPSGLEATLAKAPDLARCFETVTLAAPQPDEAVKILEALKPKYEQFHRVSFAPGAIEMAVYASGRFLPHRSLPDRALDLLDEAAAHARVRREREPAEVIALRKEIRRHVRNLEDAVSRQDVADARSYSEMERSAREKLQIVLEQHRDAGTPSVTREHVEQVAADRVGAPVSTIRAILAKKGPAGLDEILARLADRISVEQNPWLPLLAAYIARASDADTDALVEAIRAARLP